MKRTRPEPIRAIERACLAPRPNLTAGAMDLARSPLARPFPDIPPIDGVTLRIARARYKEWDRCDLTFVELPEGSSVAGVFTKNVCCSSEVELGREQIKGGSARALIVNAGNSNAFTGYRGREAVEQVSEQVAAHLACPKSEVFVSSTGVIGASVTLLGVMALPAMMAQNYSKPIATGTTATRSARSITA